MKVQYLVNIPSPYRVDFFSELSKYVELTVIYERRSASDRDERWIGEKKSSYKEIYLDAQPIGTDNSISLKVIKVLDLQADVIVIGMYSTLTSMIAQSYLRARKKPYVINSDGGFVGRESSIKKYIKTKLISGAEWWLSTGKKTSQYLEYYGAQKEHIYTYPFSSIHEKDVVYRTDEEKKEMKKNLGFNNETVVLSVGQFIPRKGYDILLNAATQLSQTIKWVIVGGKPTNEYLELVRKYQLKNVIFIDFLKPNELYKYFIAADLFVLPTREDIWGLVINEAAAFGLPIVTTDRCIAGSEIIQNGTNGIVVKANSIEDLKTGINCILSTKFQSEFDRKKAVDIALNYTIENMAKIHAEIFSEIKGKKK